MSIEGMHDDAMENHHDPPKEESHGDDMMIEQEELHATLDSC